MIVFKTKQTSVTVDGVFSIKRKGKNPLKEEMLFIHNTEWKVGKDYIFLKVGAYSITVNVEYNELILELIKQHLNNPLDFMGSNTVIYCKSITIKEG